MGEFTIPATIPKFEGVAVRDLAQDDLVFLCRKYRCHPVLGRAFDFELRRRARAARHQAGRHVRRLRVFA